MKDSFGREIDYLRISITDLCNLRCQYCMPDEGIAKKSHSDIMTLEEIGEIARTAVGLGIRKIRITGGEPLVRKGVVELCREIGSLPGLDDLSITTNGTRLAGMAEALKAAGVNRINISIDTLDPEKYRTITRGGALQDVLDGMRAAVDCGMAPVKLNTVLIGGFNDDEIAALAELTRAEPIEVRFIELMPIGHTVPFGKEAYIPCSVVLEKLPELVPAARSGGVARLYRFPDGKGRVGLISPLSNHFCNACNRIRLTADGKLKPCLHSAEEIPVRGLHGKALEETLRTAVWHKPSRHGNLSDTERSEAQRNMNQIGG